jgi:hypothetical protein
MVKIDVKVKSNKYLGIEGVQLYNLIEQMINL